MAYKATQDMVQRVMPLLEQLATDALDKARLLQYLSATAGVDWGVMKVVSDGRTAGGRVIRYRDMQTGAEHELMYPELLSDELESLVVAEYKRLAVAKPLTAMNQELFNHFFALTHCARCQYRGLPFGQIHRECHFAGWPVNFDSE